MTTHHAIVGYGSQPADVLGQLRRALARRLAERSNPCAESA